MALIVSEVRTDSREGMHAHAVRIRMCVGYPCQTCASVPVMAYIVMAYIVMAYLVMTYIVIT